MAKNNIIFLFEKYNSIPITNGLLEQKELDLSSDRNTNLFTYRGQFSPDLINGLIKKYAKSNSVILDPFCGSGTVLFESTKLNHSSFGIEINPAGFLMSQTTLFHNCNSKERTKIFKKTKNIVDSIPDFENNTFEKLLFEKMNNTKDILVKNILINTFFKYSKSRKKKSKDLFVNYLSKHLDIINNLPYSKNKTIVFHSDVRNNSIDNNSVDLIITSPPYINVFNYHQHYRDIVEKIGFAPLIVAKSEFGSNRKHRENRFLTVIQYAQDMFETFQELHKKLKDDGRFIMVIGRQSKVRGVPFRNDEIIAIVSYLAGFDIDLHQERKFKNQFGELIYEDLLHFIKKGKPTGKIDDVKELSTFIFNKAIKKTDNDEIRKGIESAISKILKVPNSPILNMEEE
jgi:DNA modification methylase